MKSLALCLARLSATAWVGAAVLFVVVGVREVTAPQFSSEIRDHLALIRFPAFYLCGAVLNLTAWFCTVLCAGHPQLSRPKSWIVATLLTLVLAGMAADYVWIYTPLATLITPAGKPRTMEFTRLHEWSTRVNAINLLLCTIAAAALNWPQCSTNPSRTTKSREPQGT